MEKGEQLPILSIVIVNYNTPELTIACIKSALVIDRSVSREIILIDNGSSKESRDQLEDFVSKNKKICFWKNNSNLGYAKANNQGIKLAGGKYILLLNSDTVVKQNAFSTLVAFAEKNPDAGVVGSKLLNADGTIQPSCLHFPTLNSAIQEYWLGKKGLFEKYAPSGSLPTEVDAVVGAAFLITPKAIKQAGILNEQYFMYFEDLDYCRKIKKNKLKVYYLPDSQVVHYHGQSGKKIAAADNQWKRLIPSSKIYHGMIGHYFLTAVLWSGQKFRKLLG